MGSGLLPVLTEAAQPPLPEKEFRQARKIYVAKCAKCHRFYDPKNYSEGEWREWMDSMSHKSKLKPVQKESLNRLLDAYRAGKIPDPAKR
jgi:hypothetical protein